MWEWGLVGVGSDPNSNAKPLLKASQYQIGKFWKGVSDPIILLFPYLYLLLFCHFYHILNVYCSYIVFYNKLRYTKEHE